MKGAAKFCLFLIALLAALCAQGLAAPISVQEWNDSLESQLIDCYQDPASANVQSIQLPTVLQSWTPAAREVMNYQAAAGESFPYVVGLLRARMQQAITIEMAAAIRAGNIERAKELRAELNLPRGVSAVEGALILQSLSGDKRDDASRILSRESITWQSTRVRQLLDECARSVTKDEPLPGRLMERLGEAITLTNIPNSLRQAAGLTGGTDPTNWQQQLATVRTTSWGSPLIAPLDTLRESIEASLPSLLSDKEVERRQRLLLKLVQLIPKEYSSGIRAGQVTVPLEYREAITFSQQAQQIVAELAPIWLAQKSQAKRDSLQKLEDVLEQADKQIAAKNDPPVIEESFNSAAKLLQNDFGVTLRRSGTTADIVEEVMLETHSLLAASLNSALAGNWSEAERQRVEAYTTYDPELEARLMPRDPELATNIERLLLDGLDRPGVKVLLDRHASPEELSEAYETVNQSLHKAAIVLQSGISPVAAAMNAGTIVLREGLEGLLVIVAIFAGLRGEENAQRRRLFWIGIVGSLAATAVTWALSQTVVTSLRAYGEVIAAVFGILAIVVLLLITNWLFHQIYWRQWVTALKSQAEGESAWQLISVGFLVGYREGFETVLFLQSLVLEAGGKSVSIGVAVGALTLLILGIAALRIGMKLPYFKILLFTAIFIGIVLITFVGSTVRAAQTVGWLPVHRLTTLTWPTWLGNWLGLYNTVESFIAQLLTVLLVLGTWRIARFQTKRKAANRRAAMCALNVVASSHPAACEPGHCQIANGACETSEESACSTPVTVTIESRNAAPSGALLKPSN